MEEKIILSILKLGPAFIVMAFMLYYVIKDRRLSQEKEKEKDLQQNKIEEEFRFYLIEQGQQHHAIIQRNTEAFEKLIDVIQDISHEK